MEKRQKNSRAVAAKILSYWISERRFPDRQLAYVQEDNAFVMELVNGVVRQKLAMEWLAQGMVKTRPDPYFEALLFIGFYQLLFMDVEEYAAIHETVEAAKHEPGGEAVSKMINAVLRRTQREKADIFRELKRADKEIRLMHPMPLIRRWSQQFGEREAEQLCNWNNEPPETILRVEPLAVNEPQFLKACEEAGIVLRLHPFSGVDRFYTLPRGVAVPTLPGYAEGWFTVQDPATSVAVNLLSPRPGERVLDACAAPGGKMAMMAARMKGSGELVAMDVHDDRIVTLNENIARLKLGWVEVIKGDAAEPDALAGREFDAILLDVPCLNSGVMRRRVDARWRLTPKRIAAISETQYRILTGCAALLAEGGRLVYSTCSLEADENEDLVARWVREHPGFRRVKAKRAFPPVDKTDGAFAALIRRD
jgi:16S rRNA (cytosine967-C5)-methyltransferase